jgi:hypothetical protein
MAKKKDDNIIDLDADEVIEHVEKPVVEEVSPPPFQEPAKAKSKSRSGLVVPLAALVLGAVGGGWFYKDYLSTYFPSDQTRGLVEKIDVLEKGNASMRDQLTSLDRLSSQLKIDLDAIESKEASLNVALKDAQTSTGDKFSSIEQQLADMQKTVADLAARPVQSGSGTIDPSALTALTQRIEALEKEIAILKTKPAEAPDNTAVLSQTLSDMKAKVAAGAPYMDDMLSIQRMVPAADGLDVLQRHAAAGIPDAKGLSTELKNLIADLPKPLVPGPVPESEGWWAWIVDGMSSVITVRVEGDVDWPTAASAAAALAESGDLSQAMEQLNAVEDSKPPAIQQWMERAQARLNIDQAVQSVEEAVLRVIAAKAQ